MQIPVTWITVYLKVFKICFPSAQRTELGHSATSCFHMKSLCETYCTGLQLMLLLLNTTLSRSLYSLRAKRSGFKLETIIKCDSEVRKCYCAD